MTGTDFPVAGRTPAKSKETKPQIKEAKLQVKETKSQQSKEKNKNKGAAKEQKPIDVRISYVFISILFNFT